VMSKAFSISKNIAAVDMLKLRDTWSVSLIHCSVVLWRARKPTWFAFSKSFSSRCLWTTFCMTFQKACLSWTGGLSVLNFVGILGTYLASVRLSLLLPSTGYAVWTDFPNSNRVVRKKFDTGKTMDSGWCLWFIPFQ
jgi:hypothetical protein